MAETKNISFEIHRNSNGEQVCNDCFFFRGDWQDCYFTGHDLKLDHDDNYYKPDDNCPLLIK